MPIVASGTALRSNRLGILSGVSGSHHESRGSWLCRRALDLVYALVNEGNIQSLTRELLDYLQVADAEFKPDLTAKIAALVQRFAPDKRWHFDSLLQVPVSIQPLL